ncbi:MAG: non-homologous end-joining DNA ligase [Microthrixaceae bacterium]
MVTTPRALRPMNAVAGPVGRRRGEWAYEVKWDGMRALAHIAGGTVRLVARSGNDVTVGYPELSELGVVRLVADPEGPADAPLAEPASPLVLDGEIVRFDEAGRPDFAALQERMGVVDPMEAAALAVVAPVVFVVFDVLWTPVGSVLDLPYDRRRALLGALDGIGGRVLIPPVSYDETAMVEVCRERGLEGVVAKRRDSTYRPGARSEHWRKTKFTDEVDAAVVGWTEGSGAREGSIGALLLALPDRGAAPGWRFCGKVGTGMGARELLVLGAALADAVPASPLAPLDSQRTGVHWVEPAFVVAVRFAEWSPSGRLRHPVYLGLRPHVALRSLVSHPHSPA